LLFFSGSGVCTQGMVFASQMFYLMRHIKSHFLICFSDVISVLHRLAWDNDPSPCPYNVAGIRVTPTTHSLFGVLLTFLMEPASNHDSSISASWKAGLTSMSQDSGIVTTLMKLLNRIWKPCRRGMVYSKC
jgi:hypothetical protein